MKLKALKPSYKEIEATYGHGRKEHSRLNLSFGYYSNFLSFMTTVLLQVVSKIHDISTNGLLQPIFSQQKMERLVMIIPKPTTSTSNGKHQLLTRMLQAPRVLGG